MTPRTGPFHQLTDEQWARVRESHRRFLETKNLGRPLFVTSGFGVPAEGLRPPDEEIVLAGPRARMADVDECIRREIRIAWLMRHAPRLRDAFPAIRLDRPFYGQSQRLAEVFGCRMVASGPYTLAEPAVTRAEDIRRLKPRPISECHYMSRSLDLMEYVYESTEGRYHIEQMVTTGPIDTVNYILGTTLCLESLYTHPREMHMLLRMVTDMLIEHVQACQRLTGGMLVPDHARLLKGYCLCSELRSEFGAGHYEEFEAPYLREIGEACGPIMLQGSGRWEQSIAATVADPHIFHVVVWVREVDLPAIAAAVGGRVSLTAWRSDLKQYSFPDEAACYRYVMESLGPQTRCVFTGVNVEAYNRAFDELERAGTLPAQIAAAGRLD